MGEYAELAGEIRFRLSRRRLYFSKPKKKEIKMTELDAINFLTSKNYFIIDLNDKKELLSTTKAFKVYKAFIENKKIKVTVKDLYGDQYIISRDKHNGMCYEPGIYVYEIIEDPIYEWQFICKQNGFSIVTDFMTDQELLKNRPTWKGYEEACFVKDVDSRRERQVTKPSGSI